MSEVPLTGMARTRLERGSSMLSISSLSSRTIEPTVICDDELGVQKLRFSELKLYGRDLEAAQLREAYDKVRKRRGGIQDSHAATGVPKVALISGSSGTGKSALAQVLSGHARRTNGLFTAGKFDMKKRSEPYKAFIAAFNHLCDIISPQKRTGALADQCSTLAIRSAVCDAVGSESSILMEVVPNLSQILVKDDKKNSANKGPIDTGYENTRNKFNFLVRRFLRAFCSHKPLVLFLDDLQWADMASLDLLKTLISDRNNPDLLVVGCYRDNELQEKNHPLQDFIHEINASNHQIGTSIALGNLDQDTVNELVADLLTSTIDKTKDLARIVHQKTHGNIFAITQFLKTLEHEGILSYCLGTLRWKWDEQTIQRRMSVTDNVADIVILNIKKKIPLEVMEVLQIAACLGGAFDSSMLPLILDKNRFFGLQDQMKSEQADSMLESILSRTKRLDLEQCLDLCVKEGLLEKDDGPYYNFAHDQISSAVFSLIPEKESRFLQFQIGQILLESLSGSEFEKNLFVIAGLLSSGLEMVPENIEQRHRMSKVYLRAGKKAMKSSAFESAVTYLKTGISLLETDHWTNQAKLSLDLFCTVAKAECCNGHLEEMKNYLDEIFCQNLNIEEKADAYNLQMYSMQFLQGRCTDALNVGLTVLAQLGVSFPKKSFKIACVKEILKTKHLLKGRQINNFSNHFEMKDESKLLVVQIMDSLLVMAYNANPSLFVLVVLKMIQLAVCHGVSKYSSITFGSYGIFLCGVMGDVKEGNKCANVARALLKRFDAEEIESKILFVCTNFISHWVEPAHIIQKRFHQAYEVGKKTGDVGWAMFNLRSCYQMALFVGKPLAFIDEECRSWSEELKLCEQKKSLLCLLPTWQLVLNMMEGSQEPQVLSGRVMKQEELLEQSERNGDTTLKSIIRFHQLCAAYYFEDFDLASLLIHDVKDIEKKNISSPIVWRSAFYEGLASFSLARRSKSRRWKSHATKVTSKVQRWVSKGNVNCKHVLALFQAEMAVLRGKEDLAKQRYNEAISIAAKFGFVHDRATASERAGEYMVEIDDADFAFCYIANAYRLYIRWGAAAKARHLYNKHRQLLGDEKSLLSEELP